MSTWNYRVIRKKHESGDVVFQIHEVYYNEFGQIDAWTRDPVHPAGESTHELWKDMQYFLSAFQKPVLEEINVDGKDTLQLAHEERELSDEPGAAFLKR